MRLILVLAALAAAPGCLASNVIECAGGSICPQGLVCDDAHGGCVSQAQLDDCRTAEDLTPCKVGSDPGLCNDHVCRRAVCGDDFVVTPEECEPGQTTTCTALGYLEGGEVRCDVHCLWDPLPCAGICNDGNVDPGEDCDGADLGDVTDCLDLDYYFSGPVSCDTLCHYDDSMCRGRCGDGVLDDPEQCEDAWTSTEQCDDFGFDAGALACNDALCTPDFAGCDFIGFRHVAVPIDGYYDALTGSVQAGHQDLWVRGGTRDIAHFDGDAWADIPDASLGVSYLRGLWAPSPAMVWIAANAGKIRRWDGAMWQTEVCSTRDLNAIMGTAADDVWAVGTQGTVCHRDATGWTRVGIGANDLYALWVVGAHQWIGGAGGTVIHDGAVVPIGTSAAIVSVWASADDDVWAADNAGVIHHHDGVSWTATPLGIGMLTSVRGTGPRDVWAAGNGVLAHWDGAVWTAIAPVDLAYIGSIWTDQPGDVWLGGSSLARAPGRTWSVAFTPQPAAPISGAAGTDSANAWLSAFDGVRRFDGTAWVTVGPGDGFTGAWGSGPDDMWFAGPMRGHWDGSWSTAPASTAINTMWGSGPHDIWALGVGAEHFDGAGWTPVPWTFGMVSGVWGWGPDDVWAVGLGVTHWHGGAWSSVTTPATAPLAAVWGSGPTDVWAVGGNGTILHYDGTWTDVAPSWLTAPLGAVWGSGPDDVWVSGFGALLVHFDGVAWSRVRSPASPETHLTAMWGAGRELWFGGDRSVFALDATSPLSCRDHEHGCGDAVDDDCDGAIDLDDADCATAVRLDELDPDPAGGFLEVVNRSGTVQYLSGLALAWQLGCDGAVRRKTFPVDAFAGAGEGFRIVDSAADVRARERYVAGGLCDGAAVGWAALCAGPCDLATCANVIDYLAVKAGASAPVGPACAAITPDAVDDAGLAAGQSVTRTGFAGSGANASAADWTILTATRD